MSGDATRDGARVLQMIEDADLTRKAVAATARMSEAKLSRLLNGKKEASLLDGVMLGKAIMSLSSGARKTA